MTKESFALFLFGSLAYASILLLVSFGVSAWGLARNPNRPPKTYNLAVGVCLTHACLTALFLWLTFEILADFPVLSVRLASGLAVAMTLLLFAKSRLIWAMSRTYRDDRNRWPYPVYWIGLLVWAGLVTAYWWHRH